MPEALPHHVHLLGLYTVRHAAWTLREAFNNGQASPTHSAFSSCWVQWTGTSARSGRGNTVFDSSAAFRSASHASR